MFGVMESLLEGKCVLNITFKLINKKCVGQTHTNLDGKERLLWEDRVNVMNTHGRKLPKNYFRKGRHSDKKRIPLFILILFYI